MNQNRIENKSHLLQYAMHAGIFLGVFWALRYLLVIFGADNLALRGLNSLLSIGTPVLLFYFLKNYKEKFLNDTIGFGHGIQFSILLFFFGSILEALIVLFHVKWIDPNFIVMMHDVAIQAAQSMPFLGETVMSQLAEQPIPSPFMYVFRNVFAVNTFIGLLLSLIIVPIVQRFKIVRNES